MSHSIFDGLSVVSLDGTGLTVQQLLDSTLIQNTVTIDDQNVTSTNSSIDELNSNYTSISVIDEDLSFDDDDLFQCGRCKFEFSSLESFMVHKRSQCSSLKVKKEASNDRSSIPSSSSGECDSQQQGGAVNHVSSSIVQPPKEGAGIEPPSREQNEKLNCSLSSSGSVPETQSVVINDGEFFNLALDGTQVFTLQENLGLSSIEGEKIIDGKFRAASLIQESDAQLNSTSLPCIFTEEIAEGAADTNVIPHIKTENGMDSTLVVPVLATESKTNDCNRILIHGRMPKGENNKEKLYRNHSCMFCNKNFTKNFDLQQHIRSHTGEKPFQCIVCGRAFAQKSNVKKHMSTHKVWPKDSVCNTLPKEPIKKVLSLATANDSGDEGSAVKEELLVDNSYVCPFCSLVHNSYLELRSHMKHHKDQKVYRCIQKECDKTFVELDAFLDHTREPHDKEVQYRCHTCSKLFGSLHALGFHQFEHSIYPWPKKSGPSYFRCTKCMNKYASAEALDHHLKMTKHHFPCKECSRIFSSERLLRTHLRVHGNANLFTCATCCKDLKSEHSLKVHQLIHTGERPFECHICNSAFNRKDKLKRHMLVHEPKKFKCLFNASLGCQREFSRKDKLRLHLLSHTHASSKKRATTAKGGGVGDGEKREIKESNCVKTEQTRMEVTEECNGGEGVEEEENVVLKEMSSIEPPSIREKESSLKRPVRTVRKTAGSKNERSSITEAKIRVKKHVICQNGLTVNKTESELYGNGQVGMNKTGTELYRNGQVGVDSTNGMSYNDVSTRVREHEGVCLNGLTVNETDSDVYSDRQSVNSPRIASIDGGLPHNNVTNGSYDPIGGLPHNKVVTKASFDSIEISDETCSSSRNEFIMTYSDGDDNDTVGENVEIIYIPFTLGQDDFIPTTDNGNKKDNGEMITTSVGVESDDATTLTTAVVGTSQDSDESFFVSTEEIDNLDEISAEILLTEPNLSVIPSDVTGCVGINDSNSFFVVKGVDAESLSFDDTRTIILENKEDVTEDFCV